MHRVFNDQHLQKLMEQEGGRLPRVDLLTTIRSQFLESHPILNGHNGHGQRDFLNSHFQRLVQREHQDFSKNPKVATARKLVKQIRSARKMFKLLKFIDEYKSF